MEYVTMIIPDATDVKHFPSRPTSPDAAIPTATAPSPYQTEAIDAVVDAWSDMRLRTLPRRQLERWLQYWRVKDRAATEGNDRRSVDEAKGHTAMLRAEIDRRRGGGR